MRRTSLAVACLVGLQLGACTDDGADSDANEIGSTTAVESTTDAASSGVGDSSAMEATSSGGESTTDGDGDSSSGSPDDTGQAAVPCADFESPLRGEPRMQMELPPADIRNYQYCEVLLTFANGDGFCTEVYASISFSACPDAEWYELDADDIEIQSSATLANLNGPRHWVMDGLASNTSLDGAKITSFGNLQMLRAAVIERDSLEKAEGLPYVENIVERSTTYTYAAGTEVYELTSETGEVYVMQSYSRIVDPDLSIDDLAGLGERLSLPEGWTFGARVLDEDLQLVADGEAFVVADGLENSYQRRPRES